MAFGKWGLQCHCCKQREPEEPEPQGLPADHLGYKQAAQKRPSETFPGFPFLPLSWEREQPHPQALCSGPFPFMHLTNSEGAPKAFHLW